MIRVILILFVITGCANNKIEKKNNTSSFNFSKDLSLEEFKIKLDEYANQNTYPNIDN